MKKIFLILLCTLFLPITSGCKRVDNTTKYNMQLNLKENILICSINHKGNITTAGGQSVIQAGDTVVLVTTTRGFQDIRDILR